MAGAIHAATLLVVSLSLPSPTVTPMAAVNQTLAAVVSPLSSCCSLSFRIVPGFKSFAHRDRGGMIESHDRRRIYSHLFIEGDDLRPDSFARTLRFSVDGSYDRLDLLRLLKNASQFARACVRLRCYR